MWASPGPGPLQSGAVCRVWKTFSPELGPVEMAQRAAQHDLAVRGSSGSWAPSILFLFGFIVFPSDPMVAAFTLLWNKDKQRVSWVAGVMWFQ